MIVAELGVFNEDRDFQSHSRNAILFECILLLTIKSGIIKLETKKYN